jgi:hypothetical protein
MSSPEHVIRRDLAVQLGPVVNEALMLAGETSGLSTALHLRSDVKALTSSLLGRLVVASESGQQAAETIVGLVGRPGLAATLARLPRVRTTYRFATNSSLTLTSDSTDLTVPLRDDGSPVAPSDLRASSQALLQLEVALPAPVLSWVSIVHLADLNRPGVPVDPWASLTDVTSFAYIKRAAAPLSAAEVAFLHQAGARVRRAVLLLTDAGELLGWADAAQVDQTLLGVGLNDNAAWSVKVLPDEDPDAVRGGLMGWLGAGCLPKGPLRETLALVRTTAAAVLATTATDQRVTDTATDEMRQAEAATAAAMHAAMTWLPRLGFELSRLRADMTERASRTLLQLEQKHDQAIQSDVGGVSEVLPRVLLAELHQLSAAVDDEMCARLESVAHSLLGDRFAELLPGGVRRSLAPSDVGVRLVDVSQVHLDGRTEMFANLGQFNSGRQSLTLLSSVASVMAVPVALVGGVIGLGFLRVGRQSRQDGQARVQATRWLKVQVAEAGRVLRHRIDHTLNEAQLAFNLAVREHHDRSSAETRARVEGARCQLAEAEAVGRNLADEIEARASRARHLAERCMHLEEVLALPDDLSHMEVQR